MGNLRQNDKVEYMFWGLYKEPLRNPLIVGFSQKASGFLCAVFHFPRLLHLGFLLILHLVIFSL